VFRGSSPITPSSPRQKHTRSQGPSLNRRYPGSAGLCPCPTPARSVAQGDVEAATSHRTGLPRYPCLLSGVLCPVPPADRMGAPVDFFPIRAAFLVLWASRHPHPNFRGMLRLHSRYGPSDRSTAQGGLRHEASIQPVARPKRSSATRAIDNSLGGSSLHWIHAPSGRTTKTLSFQRLIVTWRTWAAPLQRRRHPCRSRRNLGGRSP